MNRETIMDNTCIWIAIVLPKRFIYFATIELWARTTSGKYGNISPSTLTVAEALDKYTERYKL